MLLAPTAWRRKIFVRGWPNCGPPWPSRHRRSPGEEHFSPWVGPKCRGLWSKCVPRLSVPSHVVLHCARRFRPMGELVGALRLHCNAAGAGADRAGQRRARRFFFVMASLSKALCAVLYQPTGRKVPAGACAGGSRVTPGVGQAMRAARARWGERERARRAAAVSLVRR